jgi:2-polyprenyl-6-methoxyphenol hydroxylase-like FAD-dependent oxidoreductase
MNIGIVGAGISGLHLALRLQQSGVDTTLYSTRTAEEQRAGRPANFVARFGRTRARERALDVAHWDFPDWSIKALRMTIGADHPLTFQADLLQPGSGVDFRVYLPQLMDDYEARGGSVVIGPAEVEDIERRGFDHDLVVVASGGKSVAELFPRDPRRSPYTGPQRQVCVGLYRGIARKPTPGVDYHISPGAGEIFCYPFYSLEGKVTLLGFEAVPGGPFAHLAGLYRDEDQTGYLRGILDVLAVHAPALRERITADEFALTRPLDGLRGAVTPAVRHGWSRLSSGRYAIAVGDAWVTNDPITGQGANLGSECAFLLADAILSGRPLDEHFCRVAEARMWSVARSVTEWTNSFLRPPPAHVRELFGTAAADERVAHAFLNNFNDPVAMWDSIATADRTASFLARVRGQSLAQAG